MKKSAKPNFEVDLSRVSANGLKKYQIFASHASADKTSLDKIHKIEEKLKEHNIELKYDRSILHSGFDFQTHIEDAIKCYAGVIIMSEPLLASNWCSYEIGFFYQRNMPVFVFDPYETREADEKNAPSSGVTNAPAPTRILDDPKNMQLASPLIRGAKVFSDMDEMVKSICKYHPLSVVFENGTEEEEKRSNELYNNDKTEVVEITLSSTIFSKDRQAFENCAFGILDVQNGYDKNVLNEQRQCDVSECTHRREYLMDDGKKYYGCELIVHAFFNGFISDDKTDGVRLTFFLPVRKTCGTTFKLYIDAPNEGQSKRLTALMNEAGLDAQYSNSIYSNRIFIAIPTLADKSIENLGAPYDNNFVKLEKIK